MCRSMRTIGECMLERSLVKRPTKRPITTKHVGRNAPVNPLQEPNPLEFQHRSANDKMVSSINYPKIYSNKTNDPHPPNTKHKFH